jgi:Zn-finger nucleic acid-binding protein
MTEITIIEFVTLTCPFCGEEIPASKKDEHCCPKCSGEWLPLPLPELMKWPD